MAQKLVCGQCGGLVVFRKENAEERRVILDIEGNPALELDPIEAESVEGLFCTGCENWYADESEDVLAELPALLARGTVRWAESTPEPD